MMKCPFRKTITRHGDWIAPDGSAISHDEQFLECIGEDCAAYVGDAKHVYPDNNTLYVYEKCLLCNGEKRLVRKEYKK